jgi:hypothetical protein
MLQTALGPNSIEPLRGEVLQSVSQLDAKKSEVRDLRTEIFGHQQHILKSRLESAEVDDGLADGRNALASHFLSTKQIAVGKQQLPIQRSKGNAQKRRSSCRRSFRCVQRTERR